MLKKKTQMDFFLQIFRIQLSALQQFFVTAINLYHISYMSSIFFAPERKVFEGTTKLKGFGGGVPLEKV